MNKLEESILLYISGLSTIKVRKITGITISVLAGHLKKRGLTRSNKQNSRKYHVNHDFFEKIDDEHKAYWLGMLHADGFVSARKNQKCIGLSLHVNDKHHVEKFRDTLNSNYDIKTYTTKTAYGLTTYSRLLMTSEKMFSDLLSHGVIEQKSLVLKFPNISPDLRHHFIRGYFDGDGSFSKSHDGYKFNMCGTKEFLNDLSLQIGFPNRKLSRRYKKRKTNNYYLEIGGRLQVIAIGDYMYRDATVYLKRKHQRYMNLKQD